MPIMRRTNQTSTTPSEKYQFDFCFVLLFCSSRGNARGARIQKQHTEWNGMESKQEEENNKIMCEHTMAKFIEYKCGWNEANGEISNYILTLAASVFGVRCVCGFMCGHCFAGDFGAECASIWRWWWLREDENSQKQYPSAAASNNKIRKITIVREFDSHKVDVGRIASFYDTIIFIGIARWVWERERERRREGKPVSKL